MGHNPIYPTLGLAGEAGEVAEKVKKVLRDNGGEFDAAAVAAIQKELGDVLWYVARLATELGLDLEDVASHNLAKLADRKARDQLHGGGMSGRLPGEYNRFWTMQSLEEEFV